MTPFCSIHGTVSHWTVMLDEVTSDILTELGEEDGAVCVCEYRYRGNLKLYEVAILY